MEKHSTMLEGILANMFNCALSLDNNLANNLRYLTERIEKVSSPLTYQVRQSIDAYTQERIKKHAK